MPRPASARSAPATAASKRTPRPLRQPHRYHAPSHTVRPTLVCPYCDGTRIRRDGLRATRHGSLQRYHCAFCERRFTPLTTTHRTYPVRVIIETLSRYNRLHPLPTVIEGVRRKFGVLVPESTARRWLADFASLTPFLRLRAAARAHAPVHRAIAEHRLLHGQVYDFKYHRTKTDLLLTSDPRNAPLASLQRYLEGIPEHCPHALFLKDTPRASQTAAAFPTHALRITARRDNLAVESARFALQAVARNTERHPTVQEFLLVNDTATVAVEVPIVLTAADLAHYRTLGFTIPLALPQGEVITGHLDVVQLRNGQVHILDYKPDAAHVKPIEQLMVYALALARRTGLRLYHFRCAWFDDRDYFEFYPLHLVHRTR